MGKKAKMEPVVVWRRAAKSGARTPLVVLLHGRGADEYDLLDVVERLPREFHYASVRAPVRVPGGGYTWFENHGVARPVAGSLQASVARLRAWLDGPQVRSVSERCYLFGFSAGMMMAGALLLDDARRFTGAVMLSGAVLLGDERSKPGALDGLPLFYGRGTLDDVIPHDLVTSTERYLKERSGAQLTLRLYDHAHTISNGELDDIAVWLAGRD